MCTDAKEVINKKEQKKRNKILAENFNSKTTTTKEYRKTKTRIKTSTRKDKATSLLTSSSSSSSLPAYSASKTALSTTSIEHHHYHHKTGLKWKIIISSIIFLLCRISHVLAIRKGRLMSPSTFTALSGDLHVQIQFSAEDVDFDTAKLTTQTTTTTSRSTTQSSSTSTTTRRTAAESASNASTTIENTIITTLVISKYVDDLSAATTTTTSSVSSNEVSGDEYSFAAGGNPGSNASYEQILQRRRKEIVQNIPLYPDPRYNVTQIAVPCQTFMQGGLYEMQVVTNLKTSKANTMVGDGVAGASTPTVTTTTLMPVIDERLRQTLDVRWPAAEMRISPVRLKTYPEMPVEVELRFPEVDCEKAWLSHNLPEFWLELIYCGKERSCAQQSPHNVSKSSILYAEQIRGYPKKKSLKLTCELFGLAGNYAVQLRPMLDSARNVPVTRRFLSVDWSDKFVFNVYARSIFPCDPHTGIGVLYEYPACILEQGDRVRVYAKLRADVASLKPPTTLHYVAEQRVVKSQYSLYFNCDLFSEKYVEYCFVYVSQAISGAVADVRMDCLPTLPVSESDTGSWGPWSEWTPCSTNCLGGTRNRYRFCDSPPPRYGAKFCEGPSVETEKCGQSIGDTWDCIYESSGTQAAKINRTEVSQEIGPGCRCGCIVHLGSSKPKRIIAGATQSCPGRSFWLLQVDGQETIRLVLNFLRLPCVTQYIKVRDGPSLSSTLLIELKGGNNLILPDASAASAIESSGAQMLVEFYAGDVGTMNTNNNHGAAAAAASNDAQLLANSTTATAAAAGGVTSMSCTGGFLANVEQIGQKNGSAIDDNVATTRIASVKSRVVVPKVQRIRSGFTLVHLSAVVFASIIILISALLGAQYVLRYRKYHLAIARRRDEGSRLHTPRTSLSSLHLPPSRAVSTTTLISEVIYLVKMRPKHKLRHSILRESIDAEALARETEFDGMETMAQMTKCDEGSSSSSSIATLCNAQTTATMKRNDAYVSANKLELISHSGTLTRKNSGGKDSDSIISSGMSSLCNSPPLLKGSKRGSRYSERYDAATLKMRADYGGGQDCESPRSSCMRDYERLSHLGRVGRSASVSLTNGCYSPAASIVSTATIRTTSASTNPKESKEKQNRKKLLARPGSEFSLGNQEELELDYYDYNVDNAGATPGSYLGMDPAYLIWIPPFDDVGDDIDADKDEADDDGNKKSPEAASSENEPLYEEIKIPRYTHYLSPGSNTETTSSASTFDELSPLSSKHQSKASSPSDTHNLKNCLIQKAISNSNGSNNGNCNGGNNNFSRPPTPRLTRKQRRAAKKHCQSTMSLRTTDDDAAESFALHELSGTKSARSIAVERTATTPSPEADEQSDSYVEKETAVVKSPSDVQDFLALDDIQFADESENSDHDVTRELELKLKRESSVQPAPVKTLKAKRIEAADRLSGGGGLREVTV